MSTADAACSASTIFAGRVASFRDVTRHPQNDRTRCLGRIASTRRPGPGTRCPVIHRGPEESRATCQGWMRRWMRCSRRDGGGVGVNGARGRAGHREGVLWVRHAVVATPSFFRRRGSGSPAGHDAPPTATVHRPATCRVVAWADHSRCSRVRYVTVWNCLVVLTKHGAEGALPGAAEGWRVRYRRPADRRVKSDHGGKTGRPFASRPVILPTCSVAGQVRPAVTLELRGRRSALVWVGRHDHPPASSGRPSACRSLPRTRQHALHAEPCPPSRRRR